MGFDFGKVISLSFDWFKRKESWKYAAIIIVAYLVSLLIIFGLTALFFPGWAGCFAFEECDEPVRNLLPQLGSTEAVLGALLAFALIFLLVVIITFVINTYAIALTQLYGLRASGFKNAAFTLSKFIRYILLIIAVELVAWFWSFNKKLRVIQWVCVLCFLALGALVLPSIPSLVLQFATRAFSQQAAMAIWALLLGVLVFIPFALIAVYNSYRLFLSIPVFLHRDIGIMKALRESWQAMRGNVLNVLVASIIIGIILVVVALIALVFLGIIIALVAAVAAPQAFLAGNLSSTLSVISKLSQILIAPVSILTTAFFIATVYSMLAGKAQAAAKP